MQTLKIKKMRPQAILPRRATSGSAGYDLCACLEEPVTVRQGEIQKIPTGIALGLEETGCAALIYARSGLAAKSGIIPANCVGVVDSDYRGEVFVPLTNLKAEPFVIHPGDRIAQLVLTPVYLPELEEADELEDTTRGAGGFGSTGVQQDAQGQGGNGNGI